MKLIQMLFLIGFLCLGLQRCDSVQVGAEVPVKTDTTTYVCAGKTHCSEMRSCGEAEFYLKNCPDTQMDGDFDGIPCEEQHCRR